MNKSENGRAVDVVIEKLNPKRLDYGYFDRFDEVLYIYRPKTIRQGETKATQLAVAIKILIFEWYEENGVYDNTELVKYSGINLTNYANWIYNNYPESRQILDRVYTIYHAAGYDMILKDLADKFLDKDFLSKEHKKPACGSIFETKGKFKFKDWNGIYFDYYDAEEFEDFNIII